MFTRRFFLGAAALTACALPCLAAPAAQDQALAAATAFLKLVDTGKLAEAYDSFASMGKKIVTKEQFISQVKAAQAQIGAASGRKLKSKTPMTELPGAPKGEYLVLEYDVKFAKKGPSVERVTPVKDTDGVWRVSGYLIVK